MTDSPLDTDPGDAANPAGDEPIREHALGEPLPDKGRRRLVDELVATGVPVVAAAGGRGGRWLVSLYIVLPLVAVAVLFGLRESPRSETSVSDGGSAVTAGAGSELRISAQNISFDTDTLTLNADARIIIQFENRETSNILHNIAIYQEADIDDPIFQGKIIPGGTQIDYEFTAPRSGDYYFQCDVHPSMNGTVVIG